MAALIEDQIHQYLIAREEERCRALEKEYEQDPKTAGKMVKRRPIDKPWIRGIHPSLCQDIDLLLMVSEFDYDLENEEFREYCASRGVLHVAGEQGSRRREIFENHQISMGEYWNDDYFRTNGGNTVKLSDERMELNWEIICIGRAKLQDCWELFKTSGA